MKLNTTTTLALLLLLLLASSSLQVSMAGSVAVMCSGSNTGSELKVENCGIQKYNLLSIVS
uniref:Uncharacterized protein n=2 Tax=Oryza TaxID=4527 RepID=A0A0E0P1M3_ORYRU